MSSFLLALSITTRGHNANRIHRIFSIEKLGEALIQKSLPLTYTPKALVKHPDFPMFYTAEADNNTLPPELLAQLLADPAVVNGDAAELPPTEFGYPRGKGRWASCINVVDPQGEEPQVVQTVDLENNEATTCAAVIPFASQDNEPFLVVGTGKDMILNPRQFSEGYIHVYRFHEDGRELEFIHRTKVAEPPTAMLAFQGKLLVGIGKSLFVYDLGMKQMLRKAQANVTSHLIVSLNAQHNRIVVGDVMQGVTYVAYKPTVNKLIPFVDDTTARWMTCSTMVDYESTAGGDKFGNVFIVRCPQKASEESDDE